MTVPGNLSSPLLATAAEAAAAAAGPIKSVRFNSGDSAYLNFTPSSNGNRKTWTWSAWIKLGKLSNWGSLFKAGDSDANPTTQLYLYVDGTIEYITYDGSAKGKLIPSQVFRDPSAWYHIVLAIDTTDATADDRQRLYINGVEVTDFGSRTNHAQNYETFVNSSSYAHEIGRTTNIGGSSQKFFDGYMADIHFIDGSALDPTSFGAFDDNGVWQAAAYSGTFGTNGFHLLDFANESTVGHDSSGNENDFTANNFSTSAGAGNDVLFDVPTNGSQSDTGAGGEVSGCYATLNPLAGKSTAVLTNGNLTRGGTVSGNRMSTIGMSSGKYYWEVTIENVTNAAFLGVTTYVNEPTAYVDIFVYGSDGNKYVNGTGAQSYGSSYGANDVIGFAYDADAGTLVAYKNGTSQGTLHTGITKTAFAISRTDGTGTHHFNFGQRAFAYSAPSGYKALCTTNLPTPTIADGSAQFDTKLWTGDGSSDRDITGYGFSPDWAWVKRRSTASNHVLMDTVRGHSKGLYSNLTSAEQNDSSLNAFNSDGFQVNGNGDTNQSGQTFVGWAWDAGSSTVSNTDGSITSSVRASQTSGFSVVSYTGSGTAPSTVGHGLNAAPSLIFFARRDSTSNWITYNSSIGASKYLVLNNTGAPVTDSGPFNNTAATSTVFTVNTFGDLNASGGTYIAYCFAPVASYCAIGEYSGNSSTDGVFVHTNFRPAWLMVKSINATGSWSIFDNKRDPFNVMDRFLFAEQNFAEQDADTVDFLSNGFKFRTGGGDHNFSGRDYLYIAFAENPFQANGGLAR